MVSHMGYIPSSVRYDASLSETGKLMYAELTAMCGVDGRCLIDYEHLAKVFTRNRKQVKQILNSLYKSGVIGKEGEFITLMYSVVEKKTMLENVDSPFIDEVIEYWNTMFKSDVPLGIRRTPTLTKRLTERQVSFTNSEIMSALINRHDYVSRNDWHNLSENKSHKVNIMIALKDDEILQKFLNMGVSKNTDYKRSTVAVKKEEANKNLLE